MSRYRENPHHVFRWLPREKRAEYVAAMRKTTAVAWRDLGRSIDRLGRAMRETFTPKRIVFMAVAYLLGVGIVFVADFLAGDWNAPAGYAAALLCGPIMVFAAMLIADRFGAWK